MGSVVLRWRAQQVEAARGAGRCGVGVTFSEGKGEREEEELRGYLGDGRLGDLWCGFGRICCCRL